MERKQISRKLHSYALIRTRACRQYATNMGKADDIAEYLHFVKWEDFEELDKLTKELAEAQAEKRFTQSIIAEKVESKISELVNKYGGKKDGEA